MEAERLQTLVDERVKEPMQHVQRFEISRTWNDHGQVFKNFSQPQLCSAERSGVVNLLNRSHLKLLKKLPSLSGLIEPRGGRRWPSMSMRCGRPLAHAEIRNCCIVIIVHLAPLCDNIFRK